MSGPWDFSRFLQVRPWDFCFAGPGLGIFPGLDLAIFPGPDLGQIFAGSDLGILAGPDLGCSETRKWKNSKSC